MKFMALTAPKRWWLEQTGEQPYVLTVNKKQCVVIGWQRYRASDLVPQPDSQQWQRRALWYG